MAETPYPYPPDGFWKRHERRLIGVAALMLLAVITVLAYISFVPQSGVACGTDRACFIKNAQTCTPATMEREIAGSIMSYQVRPHCILEKRFISISPLEPPETLTRFGGKSMTCAYKEGQFDPDLITTLTGRIADCEGPLRDALLELMSTEDRPERQASEEILP